MLCQSILDFVEVECKTHEKDSDDDECNELEVNDFEVVGNLENRGRAKAEATAAGH